MNLPTVSGINIYPVKSGRGLALETAGVLPRGLEHDRRWVVAGPDGRCITGREVGEMVRLKAALNTQQLCLTHPDHPAATGICLPLSPTTGDRVTVEVWGDKLTGLAPSAAADEWIANIAGAGSRLIYMDESCMRPIDDRGGQPGDMVSFADAFPLLVISAASLERLNSRLVEPVPMARFRPNLVVSGCAPHAEDAWSRLRIGEVEFHGVSACARCVFTTVDPDTGVRHPNQEPLRTLSSYRRRGQTGVFFGQNLIPRSRGMIAVGDVVEILG